MPAKKVPHDIKVLSGSYRSDRHGAKVQPQAPGFGDVTPPDDLNEIGRRAWSQTILLLLKSQSLSANDRDAIHQYAICAQRRAAYETDIAANGETAIHPNGIEFIRQVVKLRAAAERQMRDFQKRFGFDPTSRNQLSMKAGNVMSGPYSYLELYKAGLDGATITEEQRERLIETYWFGMTDNVKQLAGEILATDPVYQARMEQRSQPKGVATRNRADINKPTYKTGNEAG